ncbi:bactofilin family protein [Roseomonas elaeocarpi]|uniref:Polymer-forming cytoskeletal protein n=1 Tax=Roseomonas elaeocarpi TaxID=907779 RepID=A0ABV6JVQ7_9PROT
MSLPPKPNAMPGAPQGMNPGMNPGASPGMNAVPGGFGPSPAQGGAMPARPAAGQPNGRPQPAERRTLVVGKGISLQGTVADAERLVVEGTVESQMIQAQELQISHSGVFKGEVEVEDAEIAGVFDGTITARGNLIIRATGRVLGVARCRRLQVEEGGQLSGRMEMLSDNAQPRSFAPQPRDESTAEA